MSTFLITIIALKAICLIVCWRAVVIANNRSKPPSSSELDNLENRMGKLLEENEKLSKQLQAIKEKKSL